MGYETLPDMVKADEQNFVRPLRHEGADDYKNAHPNEK